MTEWWFVSSSCCSLIRDPCCPEEKPPEQPTRSAIVGLPWNFLSFCILFILIIIVALAIICLGDPGKVSKTSLPTDSKQPVDKKTPTDPEVSKEPKSPKDPEVSKDPTSPKHPGVSKDPTSSNDPASSEEPDSSEIPVHPDDEDDDSGLPKSRKGPKIDGISLDCTAPPDTPRLTKNKDDYVGTANGAGDFMETNSKKKN